MSAPRPARIPVSTYRLQLRRGFGFREVCELIPYLSRLGITEVYSSPILAARPGSSHGYDIADHRKLNPELGSEEDFRRLSESLAAAGLGLLVDFVPNHMGVDPTANLWWRDILENGPAAASARFFDIDWDPVAPQLKNKLLLPLLRDQYGRELEAGRLRIQYADGAFTLNYYEHNLPLNPRPVRRVAAHNLGQLERELGPEAPELRELQSIIFQLEHLPVYTESEPRKVTERHRESLVARERLAALVGKSEAIRRHIESNVRIFNGRPGEPESFRLLHELLEEQVYRVAYWRTARDEINYRRFFDINELAGLRMEDPVVFEATHGLLLELVRGGAVTGLRLDHVDGLFDPAGYFRRLHDAIAHDARRVYVAVEKILAKNEPLRADWAVHGTTGYEFLNLVNGLFVDSRNAEKLRRTYALFTGRQESFAQVVYRSKKVIMQTAMASELSVLAHELDRISEQNWRSRDFTLASLEAALREIVACFPVYRTYVGGGEHSALDRQTIREAVSRARRLNPAMEASIFEFIHEVLLPARQPGQSEEEYERLVRFARRFQQYTAPVQAKGIEDTAFYRYGPLVSLNEVGGDPSRFGCSREEFHAANRERLKQRPLSMLATATHDTKRGEDARARLNVLSEIPDQFRSELLQWARLNASKRTPVDGLPAPDRGDEYLFYQTLVASWPPGWVGPPSEEYRDRIRGYMWKAIKEAKIHTSWINPSEPYDAAVMEFVDRVLDAAAGEEFLVRFTAFQERIGRLGMVNSLAQTVLKIACPGVADFYQGTELWDFSLVDPDNRRPVDFALRRRLVEDLEPLLAEEAAPGEVADALAGMLSAWHDGRIQLVVTAAGLRLRRRLAGLFLDGAYLPVAARGPFQEHVVAFARTGPEGRVLAVVPRLVATLTRAEPEAPLGEEIWKGTTVILPREIEGRSFTNVFTRETLTATGRAEAELRVAAVLRHCPVALLVG